MNALELLPESADATSSRPLTTELVHRLSDVDDDRLTALCRGRSFYVGPEWLATVETLRGGGTDYFVCFGDLGAVLGLLPGYWDDAVGRGFYSPFAAFLEPSTTEFSPTDWAPTYVVGSRSAYSCEFLVDPALPQREQDLVLRSLLGTAAQHAQRMSAGSFSSLYLNARGSAQLGRVLDPSTFFLAAANAVLELSGPDFDTYARSLGRKRAASIRHERAVFAAAGYVVDHHGLDSVVDEVGSLFAALEQRHGHDDSPAEEAAELRVIAAACGDLAHVISVRSDGQMVGAVLLIDVGDTVYVRSAGFNYDVVGEAFEYFNLVYYEVVELALHRRCTRVEFGITAYAAKRARGASFEPLLGFVHSFTAPGPFTKPDFAQRDMARRAAVAAGDALLLREAGLI